MFEDSRFKPDMLKIYPCLVIKGTPLYNLWQKGKYNAIDTKEAAEIIAEGKRYIPEYCRIMRIQRDIPTHITDAGVNRTNLRQYVEQELKNKGIKCKCIRCRESGRASVITKPELKILEYSSSEGREFFISFVDRNNTLIGFCRMRFPSQFLREEITKDSALIRELHVFSSAVPIGKNPSNEEMQHRGYGKMLLKSVDEKLSSTSIHRCIEVEPMGTLHIADADRSLSRGFMRKRYARVFFWNNRKNPFRPLNKNKRGWIGKQFMKPQRHRFFSVFQTIRVNMKNIPKRKRVLFRNQKSFHQHECRTLNFFSCDARANKSLRKCRFSRTQLPLQYYHDGVL